MPVIRGVVSGVREAGGKLEAVLLCDKQNTETISVGKGNVFDEEGNPCGLGEGGVAAYDAETGKLVYDPLGEERLWRSDLCPAV